MTKLITVLIIVAVAYCGYRLFFYWEAIKEGRENQQKQAASWAAQGDSLPGMPDQLIAGYRQAKEEGNTAMRNWLKTYGPAVQDPRKAWIELDFCIAIARDEPAEARRLFAAVKQRTPPSSQVWPRVKELEETFE